MTGSVLHTVVVCFYRFPSAGEACLRSLLALQTPDLEIILVDDGSPDDTPTRLREFQQANPERLIRVIELPENQGLSAARNRAVAEAHGQYVYFTSSDCAPAANWVSQLFAAMLSPGVVAASGSTSDVPPRSYAELAFTGVNRLHGSVIESRSLIGNNMAFRRDILMQQPFDRALRLYCDEDELAWRLTELGHKIASVPTAIVHHDHPMTMGGYLRQARLQGQGSARFWYKQGRYIGRDILPLTLAWILSPLAFVDPWLGAVPIGFLFLQWIALWINQTMLKGKSAGNATLLLPLETVYFSRKALSVYQTLLRIAIGIEPEIVASKRSWLQSQRNSPL